MKHLIYIFSLLLLSCNYLDKDPDASLNVPLDSEEKIAELLTGAYPDASYFPFLETRTDNVAETRKWCAYSFERSDVPLGR